MPTANKRLYEIDGLRFVAAMAVVMCHFAGVPTGAWAQGGRATFPELNPAADFGYLGVDLFFVISGFVVLMSLWDRRPADFVVSRVVRMFPAYWACLILAAVIYYTTGWGVDYGSANEGMWQRLVSNVAMMQTGEGGQLMELVYWSLWIELHFYGLIVFLCWRGVTYRRTLIFMTGWLLLGVFADETKFSVLQFLLVPRWGPYFVAGMAFYLIYRYGANLVLWLVIGASWSLMAYAGVKQINPLIAWPGVHQYVVPAVITLIFVVMGLVATDRLRFMRWRWLAPLGALTYPLYLLHETVSRPIIHALQPRLNKWTVLAIAIAAVVASAYLIHRLIERPLQRVMTVHLKRAIQQIRLEPPVLDRSERREPVQATARPAVTATESSSTPQLR